MSAQGCGCDKGANWICEQHRPTRTAPASPAEQAIPTGCLDQGWVTWTIGSPFTHTVDCLEAQRAVTAFYSSFTCGCGDRT